MKLKTFIHAALLTIMFTLTNIITVFASADMDGYLDRLEGDTLVGWAWDRNDPGSAVDVTVAVTRVLTGQVVLEQDVTADGFRPDLDSETYGTQYHGFTLDIGWDQLEPGIYHISASVNGAKLNTLEYNNGDVDEPAGRSLGVFKTTAYCPCYSCSEGWGRHTSSGALATSQHTVAVDPRVIPIGSRLMIDGTVYTAEDVGGGVRGNHVDIYYNTPGETRQHGVRYSEVYLIG